MSEYIEIVCVTFHPLGRRRRVGVDVTLEGHGQTLEQREAEAWEAAHHERRTVCNTQQNAWSLQQSSWKYDYEHMQMEYNSDGDMTHIGFKCISYRERK